MCGAIVAPYFRHKAIHDCPISRELKTQAGKRMYYGKKMLYSLGKTAIEGDVVFHEGKTDLPLHPVMFQIDDKKEAFLYLDGATRNYQKLKKAKEIYDQQQIKTYWFLHNKYQSNARNLTSNEAEACAVNGGIIYYLDTDGQKIDFRKAYQTPYGERKYYTESIALEEIALDLKGEFNTVFLEHYMNYVMEQKRALDKVLRVPIEDGVEEAYYDFTYVYMDAIEEIWILPKLKMLFEDRSLNEQVNKRREQYVIEWNEALARLPRWERDKEANAQVKILNKWNLASNWLSS